MKLRVGSRYADYTGTLDFQDKSDILSVNAGDRVVAVCKVGNYIFGDIKLKDCFMD